MIDRFLSELCSTDYHGDWLRNIVSLRESQDLFDDLSDQPGVPPSATRLKTGPAAATPTATSASGTAPTASKPASSKPPTTGCNSSTTPTFSNSQKPSSANAASSRFNATACCSTSAPNWPTRPPRTHYPLRPLQGRYRCYLHPTDSLQSPRPLLPRLSLQP